MCFLYLPTANQVNTATVVGVKDGESAGNAAPTSAFRRAMSLARDFARMYKRLGVGKPDTGGGDTGEDISTSTQLRAERYGSCYTKNSSVRPLTKAR